MNKIDTSEESIEIFLNECISNPSKCSEFELNLKDGHTSFHDRIYTTIKADSCTTVYIPRGVPVDPAEERKRGKSSTQKIDQQAMDHFISGLLQVQFWKLENCKKYGIPDESTLHFTLLKNGIPIFEKEIWGNCKTSDSRLKSILDLITGLSKS